MPTGCLALALAVATTSCETPSHRYAFDVRGVLVVVDTDAAFAWRADFAVRLEGVLGLGLAYWGGTWRDLEGRSITFSAGPYVPCGGTERASGCVDRDVEIATWDPGVGTVACVEQTVLVHELGHAVLGDRLHEDPRWMEFDALADALAGRAGWLGDREVECAIAASVWRHPLAAP